MKLYTKEDVIQMLESGHLSLGALSKRRLNQHQVVIEENNLVGVNVLTAPKYCANDEVVDCLLHSFTLPDYAIRIGTSEKAHRNNSIRKFFTFLDTSIQPRSNTKIESLTPQCFINWFEHLKVTETSQNVWRHMHYLKFILKRTLCQRYSPKISKWPKSSKEAWQVLNLYTPRKPNHLKYPPLGVYLGIPSAHFSNQELFMGLRYGTIWLLQTIQKQRKLFRSNDQISQILDQSRGTDFKMFNHFANNFMVRKSKHSTSQRNRSIVLELATPSWKTIQKDPLLTEWQTYCFPCLRKALIFSKNKKSSLISPKSQDELLSRFINSNDNLRSTAKGYGHQDVGWIELKRWIGPAINLKICPPCLWGADYVAHTRLEQLLMVWLLSSERAQRAGIEALKFDDIHLARNGLQISTLKLRRRSAPHSKAQSIDVITQIYKLNEPVGSTYNGWLKQAKEAQETICKLNKNNQFFYGSDLQLGGTIASNNTRHITNSFLPLELIGTPGTTWHDSFLKASGNSREAQAFIAILANRIETKRMAPKAKVSIPSKAIGESLVVMKELENNQSFTHNPIENETLGHSKSTARNIYKDGYSNLGVEDIQEPVLSFARKVGDEKFKIAEKIAKRLNQKNKVISLSELESLSGIKSARSDLRGLLTKLDEQDKVTIAGKLDIGGQLLIVQTDMTAAMMWANIQHLESNLPVLINSERDQTCLQHLAQYLHLKYTYTQFDKHLQKAGRELANELQFPFPPLN